MKSQPSVQHNVQPVMKLAAVPSIVALFWSNAVLMEQYPALLSLSIFGFVVGTILFGLAWVVLGETWASQDGSQRAVEIVRVLLVCSWIYVVFSVMLRHTPDELRWAGLGAAYAVATAWWAMKLLGEDEEHSREFTLPAMIAAGIVALALANFTLPIEVLMPIAIAVIAGRNVLRLSR